MAVFVGALINPAFFGSGDALWRSCAIRALRVVAGDDLVIVKGP
jgi:hypothetical protein